MGVRSVELVVDVSDAAGLGEEAAVALTVQLPLPEVLDPSEASPVAAHLSTK